jgi:flagellar biosynthesis protein FlhF
MNLYTFKARSLNEALRLVRDELGPDASVLHTREVGSPLARLIGGATLEVTASVELEAPSRLLSVAAAPLLERLSPRRLDRVPAAELDDFRRRFRRNLSAAEAAEASLIETLAAPPSRPPERKLPGSRHITERLRRAGVSDSMVRQWLDRLTAEHSQAQQEHWGDAQAIWRDLRRLIATELRVRGPIELTTGRPMIVALVGPTGVGKTTTVAKLAAHFRLQEQKSVALITADTFRIAAALQLRTYAEILDVPMEVVTGGGDMARAVDSLRHHDLILIDTAGVSPRDAHRLAELEAILADAKPDETLLVLSCLTNTAGMQAAADALADLRPTGLIFTRLDEAAKVGPMIDYLSASKLPVSYLTTGQDVPEQIEPATAERLVELVLDGNSRVPGATWEPPLEAALVPHPVALEAVLPTARAQAELGHEVCGRLNASHES